MSQLFTRSPSPSGASRCRKARSPSGALRPGDAVTKGEELVDIESDKIVNTMEAPASGVLHRIIAEVDDTLKVGPVAGGDRRTETPAEAIWTHLSRTMCRLTPAFGIDDDEPAAAGPADGNRATCRGQSRGGAR